ncbi:MAG: hypothetical protein V2J55_16015 [Candidatus Competibacteraceae bacterium]|jgi:hypothetical protein|nr:hypothetical protein [Candidatus Competibacteraceae bacterium]
MSLILQNHEQFSQGASSQDVPTPNSDAEPELPVNPEMCKAYI